MNSDTKLLRFKDFTNIAVVFCQTLGFETFFIKFNYGYFRKFIQLLIFHIGFWNLILTIIGELIFLNKAIGLSETFMQVTALLPCIGVCIGSIAKIGTVYNHRSTLKRLMIELEDMFPRTLTEQKAYEVETYRKNILNILVPLFATPTVALTVFSFYDMVESAIVYLQIGSFNKLYPYFVWYPFDSQADWKYPVIYLHQVLAGHTAVGGGLATDMLLCCIINTLRMHFDYISRELIKIVPSGKASDSKHLYRLIRHHTIVLRISKELNKVFGLSILYNFISSSLIICFTGFQVSAGTSTKNLIKFILFLSYQLVTIFLLCYHGNILIEASTGVSNAAYNQNWFAADRRYKKCLLFMMTRARKPSIMNATGFAVVSLEAFNKIMSTSYSFFALLRSMYVRE